MLSRQQNLQQATELAFEALRVQTADQLRWLGAEPAGTAWRLPVLNGTLIVDWPSRQVSSDEREVSLPGRILALHYLAIRAQPEKAAPQVTFADLPTARTYAEVFRQRTAGRLCAVMGGDLQRLQAAATALGGRPAGGGDAAFEFDVFPRVSLCLLWHAADEEFGASATLLLPPNIESWFAIEDVIVLCERLVSRLCGRPF